MHFLLNTLYRFITFLDSVGGDKIKRVQKYKTTINPQTGFVEKKKSVKNLKHDKRTIKQMYKS